MLRNPEQKPTKEEKGKAKIMPKDLSAIENVEEYIKKVVEDHLIYIFQNTDVLENFQLKAILSTTKFAKPPTEGSSKTVTFVEENNSPSKQSLNNSTNTETGLTKEQIDENFRISLEQRLNKIMENNQPNMSKSKDPVDNPEESYKSSPMVDAMHTSKKVDENKPTRCAPEERPKSAFGKRIKTSINKNTNVPIEPKGSTKLKIDENLKKTIEESLKKQVKERENCYNCDCICMKKDDISLPKNVSTKPKSSEIATRISTDERAKKANKEGLKDLKNKQESNVKKSIAPQLVTPDQRLQHAEEKLNDRVKQIIELHVNKFLNRKEAEKKKAAVVKTNARKIQTVEEAQQRERQKFIAAVENIAKVRNERSYFN